MESSLTRKALDCFLLLACAMFLLPMFPRVGKTFSAVRVPRDHQRVQNLVTMHRPRMAGKLMQPLQAANWMRTSLSRLAEIVESLRAMLEERMLGAPRRTAEVASKRDFHDHAIGLGMDRL